MVCDELAQIQLAAGMVDVDSDQVALAVVIQNNAFRNLLALDARPVRKIDVERICVWKIIETRSLPTLTRSYPRRFTFYVADPSAPFSTRWAMPRATNLLVLDQSFVSG